MSDPEVLRQAVQILRRRAKKPKSIAIEVICRVLTDTATKIEEEHG